MKTKSFDLHIKDVSDEGTFEGYASTFGGAPDSYGDVVEAGAFAKSLGRHVKEKSAPVMLWQHNPDEPIGVWDNLAEDDKGLKGTGRFVLETTRGREAYALLKAGAIKGLSIGYRIVKGEPDGKVFRLKELDLVEISLATFPANRRAGVTAVKSERMEDFARRLRDGDPMPIKEFEDILRDAGVPKAMATQIASVGYSKVFRGDPEDKAKEPDLSPLREALRSFKTLS